MKNLGLSIILAAAALFAFAPGEATAQSAETSAKTGKPLRGVVKPYRRTGGYSYKYVQGLNTRRFVDPSMQKQSDGGPFDSGFFFSSPNAPHGGDSPYMN